MSRDKFVLLDENRLAFTALSQLIKPGRETRKPLVYLSGPAGSGKSHLVRHVVRQAVKNQPKLKQISCTAAQFAAELAEASDARTIPLFQEKYRNVDLFVCEDLRALQGRTESQQQLVFAIDHVLAHSGRCIITCPVLPGDLRDMSRKLINRCRGGVSVAIRLPRLKSRIALIEQFSSQQQVALSTEVIELLAKKLPVSPRELSAAITQLETTSRLLKKPINRELVDRYLKAEEETPSISLSQLARATAQQFGISVKQIRSGGGNEGERVPRQCAMMLARHLTQEPLVTIANFFGRKNHASVIHAAKRVEELAENDLTLQQHLARICKNLGVEPVGPRS